ncbi:hypothetical protein AB6C52_21700, partial [Vibrio cyclitrophicus]
QLVVINHSKNDTEPEVLTHVDSYYLDRAILSLLSLSTQAQQELKLYLTICEKVSLITIYQSDHDTDASMLNSLNEQYLLLVAKQHKGQVFNDDSNRTVTLEIPNVLS